MTGCYAQRIGIHYNPDVVARLTQLAEQTRPDLGDTDRVGRGQRSSGKLPVGKKPQPQIARPKHAHIDSIHICIPPE